MKSFFLLFALAMACAITQAQAPANDNACQATQLTVGTVCNYQTFTTENATASTGSAVPNCANFVGGATGDVWFKVTVPASGSLSIDTQEGAITDGGMAVYRGNVCLALTLIACDDNSSVNGDMPSLTTTGLIPGSTLYIRFWENGGDNNGTFGICVNSIQGPPNDDPCNAINLPVGTNCVYQTFTTENASTTGTVPGVICAGYSGGDVWFKVTVPATGGLLFDSQTGGIADGGMAVYSGTDCNNLTYLGCDDNSSTNGDMPSLFVGGQAPGSTLWVRFWENGNNNNGTFGICVTNVPTTSNDEPCNAIELTAVTNCNYQTFTNQYATATQSIESPLCFNYAGGDVWFKVIVPSSGRLFIDTREGVVTDGAMAVYSGTNCNSLTRIACDDNSSVNGSMPAQGIYNQVPGSIIWVRLWENGNDNRGTFDICVLSLQPPSNDNPCNAIELTAGINCTYQTFTNENATVTTGVGDPPCANYPVLDVWFKVTVPAGSGGLVFDTQQGVVTDGGMAVYSGVVCNGLNLLACDDNSSANGNMPSATVYGQIPGSTLYVRIWSFVNIGSADGTFGICVRNIPAPANDEPCNAVLLAVDTVCNYQSFTTENATASLGITLPNCDNYVDDDVWFKVIVPSGGNLFLDTQTGVITDGGMAVYTGPDCSHLTILACDDSSSSNGAMPALNFSGLQPGTTLWVRFWENEGNNNGTFGICAKKSLPAQQYVWVKTSSGPVSFGMSADDDGNVYHMTWFKDSLNLLDTIVRDGSGILQASIAKYNNYGRVLWVKSYSTNATFDRSYMSKIKAGHNGDVFFMGTTEGSFEGVPVNGHSFICKMNGANGQVLWVKVLQDYANDADFTIDDSGNVYTSFYVDQDNGVTNFGSFPISNISSVCLGKISSNGTEAWFKQYPTDGFLGNGVSLAVNPSGTELLFFYNYKSMLTLEGQLYNATDNRISLFIKYSLATGQKKQVIKFYENADSWASRKPVATWLTDTSYVVSGADPYGSHEYYINNAFAFTSHDGANGTIYTCAIDTFGHLLWKNDISRGDIVFGYDNNQSHGIAVSGGNVYVSGALIQGASVNNAPIPYPYYVSTGYLLRYDSAGRPQNLSLGYFDGTLSNFYFVEAKPNGQVYISGDEQDWVASTWPGYFGHLSPVKASLITAYVGKLNGPASPFLWQWTGAVSSEWENPYNWASKLKPNRNSNVVISAGVPHYPVVNSNVIINSVRVNTGASVIVNSGYNMVVLHP